MNNKFFNPLALACCLAISSFANAKNVNVDGTIIDIHAPNEKASWETSQNANDDHVVIDGKKDVVYGGLVNGYFTWGGA